MKKLLQPLFFLLFVVKANAQDPLLNDTLTNLYDTEILAGSSTIGIRGDTIGYALYYGKRDIARNLPTNENTMYRIASVSKSFTATALMKLYEQNLFQLDDDVNSYLGFSLRNPSYPADKITFRMLFNHTSSVQDGTGYDSFLGISASATPPPISQLFVVGAPYYTANMFRTEKPGTYFNYSNVEYGLLATLVEKISNVRFDTYVKQNILMPLNITGSYNIDDLASQINDVAVLYRKSGSAWAPQVDNYGGVAPAPRNFASYVIGSNGLVFGPQGSLRVTAKGMASYLLMIANNGVYNGNRILNDTTVRRMRSTQWNYTNSASGNNYYGLFRRWGLGLHVSTGLAGEDQVFPNIPMWGHPGEAYGLVSDMYIDTLDKKGVVFVTNGKFGGFTGCTTGFYCVEEKTFKYIYNWTTAQGLPVNLVSFKAIKQGKNIALSWGTANEINNKGFYITKSSDGINFENIGFVAAQNNGSAATYHFVDSKPSLSINYYRLVQTDLDNKQTLSQIVQVNNFSKNGTVIHKIFPNPILNGQLAFTISSDVATTGLLKITDVMGKTVSTVNVTLSAGANSLSVPLDAVAKGIYTILMVTANKEPSNSMMFVKP